MKKAIYMLVFPSINCVCDTTYKKQSLSSKAFSDTMTFPDAKGLLVCKIAQRHELCTHAQT